MNGALVAHAFKENSFRLSGKSLLQVARLKLSFCENYPCYHFQKLRKYAD